MGDGEATVPEVLPDAGFATLVDGVWVEHPVLARDPGWAPCGARIKDANASASPVTATPCGPCRAALGMAPDWMPVEQAETYRRRFLAGAGAEQGSVDRASVVHRLTGLQGADWQSQTALRDALDWLDEVEPMLAMSRDLVRRALADLDEED